MKFWKRARNDDPAPQGVRIRRTSGNTVDCDVRRDPGGDRSGLAQWIAVPREEFAFETGDMLEIDVLPARTAVDVQLRLR